MNPRYALVAARAGHRCEYCHAPEAIFNFPFEVEHVVPTGQLGPDTEDNWALACRSCNLYKSDKMQIEDPETGEVVLLFHPRKQIWDEHFVVGTVDGILIGLTSCGRATVTRFRLNSPNQCHARRQWALLGLFP